MKKLTLLFALALSLQAEVACLNGQGPLQDGQEFCAPNPGIGIYAQASQDQEPWLWIYPPVGGTVDTLTVVSFTCVPEDTYQWCPKMSIPGTDEQTPEWTMELSLDLVCPTSDAIFIGSHGPTQISFPLKLSFKLTTAKECTIKPWIYYHDDPKDGSLVGLRLDPKTQQLSVEQSEVAFR